MNRELDEFGDFICLLSEQQLYAFNESGAYLRLIRQCVIIMILVGLPTIARPVSAPIQEAKVFNF